MHIFDENGEQSPSAFIPFCGYGRNYSALGGVKFKNFNSTFCNSFRPSFVKDQLCYEVDVKELLDKDKISKGLASGLIFAMDYNEDRYIAADEKDDTNQVSTLKATIILDGLGFQCNL